MPDRPAPAQPPEPPPPDVRFLRGLVTALALVMIGGMISIVALLALRLPGSAPPPLPLPEALALPDGLSPEAVTLGADFIAIVAGDEILIFSRSDGQLRQRIRLERAD